MGADEGTSGLKHLKVIMMDHYGTLVDSEHAHYRMWVDILVPFGLELPLEDYVQYYAGRSTTSIPSGLVLPTTWPPWIPPPPSTVDQAPGK